MLARVRTETFITNQLTEKDARYYAEEGSQVYQQYIYLSNLPLR